MLSLQRTAATAVGDAAGDHAGGESSGAAGRTESSPVSRSPVLREWAVAASNSSDRTQHCRSPGVHCFTRANFYVGQKIPQRVCDLVLSQIG